MRLLLVDPDPARAALVAEGLADMRPLELRRTSSLAEAELAEFKPDLIIVACDSPDRDTLESLREATQSNPRPVVMFVDRSAPGLAEEAVHAGVAAYIVDGLQPGRVRPILEVAMSRFQLMQQLRTDLARARSDLAARKTIERAKGLLMKERQVGEEEAYAILRKLAMNTGRSVSAVAADLLSFHGVLKGDKS
jgi:two-component system, response regulator / RNA-binding antiterminator